MDLRQLWNLLKDAASAWIADYAPSMGAALAYYTLFSIAPLLLIVIAVAGFFFGAEAARGEIFAQLQELIGDEGAIAIQGLLASASQPGRGAVAATVGVATLIIGATTVFAELQNDLDRIWRAPVRKNQSGIVALVRTRLLSFGMVLGIGFILLVSLVLSAAISALGQWWGPVFGGWEALLQVINLVVSLAIFTGLFAMIYKILPSVKISWHDVWIGAAATAILFTIGKFLIGLYLGKSGVTSGFGAAGSLVVLLVWVFYSSQIFLLGAEFTRAYAHQRGSRADEPKPQSVPGLPQRPDFFDARETSSLEASATLPESRLRPLRTAEPDEIPALAQKGSAQHPLKQLALIATTGLVIGGLLRQIAPPGKLVRKPPATPSLMQRRLESVAQRLAAHVESAKSNFPRDLVRKLRRKKRRWLF
ncbi:MAG: YhjD/YihY/BrkB family envelope integrity protein [Burkholderiales bacterium]